jgi:membrane-associated phospholipid phosphatase
MNVGWLGLTAAGIGILGGSVAGAVGPVIPSHEARVFHSINGLPGWLYWVLWLPMQLGNLVVGTVAGLLVAWAVGDIAVAIGVVVAMGLKLVVERFVRKKMAGHLQIRQRPGTSEVGAVLRGADVPSSGPSFPSGHIILVAAISCVVVPAMPAVWWWVPAVLTLLVMLGRVYVGAHNPLDVTAGLGAGLVVGGVLALFVR